MLTINKLISSCVVDYAAEELKKYLRMMMPEGGDVRISYDPFAKDGFRLGLMQDLGLDVSDAEEPELDDIIYIDCDERGGIIAGDNERSILLAVYEYLRQNGCRWIMPGVDGEFIPIKDIEPVKYRHAASCRYRGWCNEGTEYQDNMIEAIEFVPKVGMNVFMIEFYVPTSYYNRHYKRMFYEDLITPEPVTNETLVQWKRVCEVEIAKRGLQFHDIGHGWSADPFGIDSSVRQHDGDNERLVPDESRQYLALVNGERKLWHNTPNYTNFCMSNRTARKKVCEYAVNYAKNHSNVDYLHVWLGDGKNNHCECEECVKKTPSDWYMILMNELDEALTKEKLDTRIVFISYVDTVWAPLAERIKNQKRFSMLLAPITRSYLETLPKERVEYTVRPYERNKNKLPGSLGESFAYFDEWKKFWCSGTLAYEYHFWLHQFRDPANLALARLINNDIKVYKERGVNGIIEDGSQRCFFPNGLCFYTYARTLFDTEVTFEEIVEDFFPTAYGEDWREVYSYLERLGELMPPEYFHGNMSTDSEIGPYYNPELSSSFEKAIALIKEEREYIEKNFNHPFRVQTVSMRILREHANYWETLAEACRCKCVADDAGARDAYEKFRRDNVMRELLLTRYFEPTLPIYTYNSIFTSTSKKKEVETSADQ